MSIEQKEKILAPESLHEFVCRARKETYATGAKPIEIPLIEGATQYEY